MSTTSTAVPVTREDLAAAGRVKVYFGHMSVGMNLIDGVPGVFGAHGLAAPDIIELGPDAELLPLLGRQSGFFAHGFNRRNGDPYSKIREFDARIRSGLAERIHVALMKLCYVDVISGTDTDALFGEYRTTMATLERDFPAVTFVHVTTPLTTEPGLREMVKKLLGRTVDGRADNVARERLNRVVRQEYGPDRLFDLAAVESTAPDGSRVVGRYGGQQYYALHDGYASDRGHLNAHGSQVAAAGLLGLIARVAGRSRT
jgi:hypothetical protein